MGEAVAIVLLTGVLIWLGWQYYRLRFKYARRQREWEREQEASARLVQRVNDMVQTRDEILVEERRRIAYLLHDDTVQRIAAARFMLEHMHVLIDHPAAKEKATFLARELAQTVNDIRVIIDDLLHPQFEQRPLADQIQRVVDYWREHFNIAIQYRVTAGEKSFDVEPEVRQAIFYIFKEAVDNAIKSSLSYRVEIDVLWEPDLRIEVRQHGNDPIRDYEGAGHGLPGMKRRAKKHGIALFFQRGQFDEFRTVIGYKRPPGEPTWAA